MNKGYGTQADYVGWVKVDADSRKELVEDTLKKAFADFIEKREVEIIIFSRMKAQELAGVIIEYPFLLKPLLVSCNIASRAIERDLSIKNVDTYTPKINSNQAHIIAGYIKPFLPAFIEIAAISQIDRVAFIDKEIRKLKGRWEKIILENLNKFSRTIFYKRKFSSSNEQYELDAAYPKTGEIIIGIDIKRIEARRDIHKRCDEIVNKAFKLKTSYPQSKFGVVIYYPFIEEHLNIKSRLSSNYIDGTVFASGSKDSIENTVKILLSILGAPS